MNGAGNDFIIIDNRNQNLSLSKSAIEKLSNRRNIGCDQFIIIENSLNCDCFMRIYNSDGSEAAACGNATRCVASVISQELKQDNISIETIAGKLNCQKENGQFCVEFSKPKFGNNFFFDDIEFFTVDVGNPHAICFVKEIPSDEQFLKIGKAVESHPFFPNKTNVEFAKICDNNIIEVRVYERGAQETLACGTGACAVACAAINNQFTNLNKVLIRFKGGDLNIFWNKQGNSNIFMTGNHKKVFSGLLDQNFLK